MYIGRLAQPEVLVRVAEVHQLPVEDRGDASILLEEVAGAVVAVDDRHPAARTGQCAFSQRMRPLG